MYDNLWSNMSPRNLVSVTIGILILLSVSNGSGCNFRLRQKCIQTVFDWENLNPFSLHQVWRLFRHRCSYLSMVRIWRDRQQAKKSSTYKEHFTPVVRHDTILLILRLNSDR